ncbi:hypothetical protein, partial [Acidaminococcus timonensis]|uniref:hypothetical protein n=1 Tax=Acidaminococcus timonensis TaxID=1871002 RepID=UPI0013565C57
GQKYRKKSTQARRFRQMKRRKTAYFLAFRRFPYRPDRTFRNAGDAGFKAKADMVMLAIVTNLYEDRVGEKKDLGYIIQSMLHQLSLWEG